jgi:hypothetical protein
MTAAAIATKQLQVTAELEQEILVRIDRAALHICEAELRYQLCWDEQRDGSLLDVLDELERRGLVESSVHFRLTERGHAELPRRLRPAASLRHRDPMGGSMLTAGEIQARSSLLAERVDELERARDAVGCNSNVGLGRVT